MCCCSSLASVFANTKDKRKKDAATAGSEKSAYKASIAQNNTPAVMSDNPPPAYHDDPHQSSEYRDEKTHAADGHQENNHPTAGSGRAVDWDFRYFNSNLDRTIYNSLDSHDKFKLYKKAEPGSAQFDQAVTLQRAGFAMPLLRVKSPSFKESFSRSVFTIYRHLPPPKNENRLFDKETDKYLYCSVVASKHKIAYVKYDFHFTPDPTDQSKNFTLVVISHNRLPIIDVSSYKGVRYRWINEKNSDYSFKKWNYSLNILDSKQPSLVDDLDAEGNVDKKNPLLGSTLKNMFRPTYHVKDHYLGVESIGEFSSVSSAAKAKFLLPANLATPTDDPESVNSVSEDTLVLLCMGAYLKHHEESKENARINAATAGSA